MELYIRIHSTVCTVDLKNQFLLLPRPVSGLQQLDLSASAYPYSGINPGVTHILVQF